MRKYQIITGVAILTLLVVGGYYLLQRILSTTGPQTQTEVMNVESAVSEPVTWKTYKSDEFGYEIQYPSNWKMIEYPSIRKDGHFNVSIGFVPLSNPESVNQRDPKTNYSYLGVSVSDHSGPFTLAQTFGGYTPDQEIEIDGVTVIRRGPRPVPEGSDAAYIPIPNSLQSSIQTIHNKKTYSAIGESYGPDFAKSHETVERILSSFKFLD